MYLGRGEFGPAEVGPVEFGPDKLKVVELGHVVEPGPDDLEPVELEYVVELRLVVEIEPVVLGHFGFGPVEIGPGCEMVHLKNQ